MPTVTSDHLNPVRRPGPGGQAPGAWDLITLMGPLLVPRCGWSRPTTSPRSPPPGDHDILIVCDAGYDAPRRAYLLEGLPVEVLGRIRTDRVMRKPVPVPWTSPPHGGRPPKHGKEFRFAGPDTWGEPDAATAAVTDRYGTARAMAWDCIHPRLTTLSAGIDHTGELLGNEGTLIRLEVDLRRQAFLRRSVPEPVRMIKQTLCWTRPKLCTPEAADRWTWLIIAAHTQLRLARPQRPGPGRPLGSENRHPVIRYDVGETVRRPETIAERDQARP